MAEAVCPKRAATTTREDRDWLTELSSDLHFTIASFFLNPKDLSTFILAAPWLTRGAVAEQCLGALFLELTTRTWAQRGGVGLKEIGYSELPGCELEASLRHRAAFGFDLKDTTEEVKSPSPQLTPRADKAPAKKTSLHRAESLSATFAAEQAARALRVSCQRAYALLPPYWPRGFNLSQQSLSPRHCIDLLDDRGIRVDTSLNVATLRTSWQHAAHVGRQQILYNATSNVRGSSSSSRSSNSSSSSSTYRTEAVAPLPPRTAVYRGNNPGGHRCVVADAPFPPLITLPWTIVRYGRASDQSQGGDCSAGCAANESADEGTKHQANNESSSTSSNSDSSNTSSNSNSSASSKSGIGSCSTSSSKAAHAGYRANESIEGAICLSFCAYYEVDILPPPKKHPSSSNANSHADFESPKVSIGLCKEKFPTVGKQPGYDHRSWGYHGDDGKYYRGSSTCGRVAGEGPSGVATFGAGDTVGMGAILLPDPTYPLIALFCTLNGSPLGPEGGAPLDKPWAEYESRLGVNFAFLLDPDLSRGPFRPVLGLDSPCPVRLRLGDSPQSAFKLPFAALARIDAVCSGHCLAGFPLAPNLLHTDTLFTQTVPRPMPGQVSALSRPPPREPARTSSIYCRRSIADEFRAMWCPFGNLLDPPGMPKDMHAEVMRSGRKIPKGWGCTKAAHVAAFAAAPGSLKSRILNVPIRLKANSLIGVYSVWAERRDPDDYVDTDIFDCCEMGMGDFEGYDHGEGWDSEAGNSMDGQFIDDSEFGSSEEGGDGDETASTDTADS